MAPHWMQGDATGANNCVHCAAERRDGRGLDRVVADRERRSPGSAAPVEDEQFRIGSFNDVVRAVIARLHELGWTRGRLAEQTALSAASLRRLLTEESANPTFATLMVIRASLGRYVEI